MKTANTLKLFVLMLVAVLTTHCGFKLRSADTIPPQLRALYIASNNPYGPFESRLKQSLHAMGITVVDAPEKAPITLQIVRTQLSYYPTSIGASNQANIYAVTYIVTLALLNTQGKILLPAQDMIANGSLTLNANQLITNNNQLAQLTQQLQKDIINRLFDLLSSQQVANAISTK